VVVSTSTDALTRPISDFTIRRMRDEMSNAAPVSVAIVPPRQ